MQRGAASQPPIRRARTCGSATAVTTWNYDAVRGWLNNKRYANNTGPAYTYKPSGRLLTRVWARTPTVTTTYSYNAAGDLTGMDYSDATPDVTLAFDRAGRPKSMTDAAGTRTMGYNASGPLEDEVYTTGALNGITIDRSFDSMGRLSGLAVGSGYAVGYGYDAASRLDTVTAGTNTATYGYASNSFLVESVTFKQSGTTRLTTTKAYDNLNRLATITHTPSVSAAISVAYTYNSANQRTKAVRETSAYWNFGYDPLGQVTSGKKFTSADAAVPGHDFAWTYDDIGNRKTAVANGSTSTYSATNLNQYSTRTAPGVIEVLGEAQADATVTTTYPATGGTISPTTRQGSLFYKQLTASNSSVAQNPSVKITGVKNLVGANGEDAVTEITKTAYVAQTPEGYTHDADGNLTDDARWHYTWDGENRLSAMETSTAAISAGVAKQKLEFAYDGQSRRFSKKVYSWSGGAWVLASHTLFLFDGWNMVAELNALSSNAVIRTYVWGTDLSGSMQGAGGVGGLLFMNAPALSSPLHAACFDGNGNVIGYVDMATGNRSATYEYGAFGETLIADGVAAELFPFRFSTKYRDSETGLVYFGLRYKGEFGWISRDPIEEQGGVNVYAFLGNDAVNYTDYLGMVGVVFIPPNPAAIVPTVNPSGISGTGFRGIRVDCQCQRDGGTGVTSISCTVSFNPFIQVSRLQANRLRQTLDGIYGHEQRHILSRIERVRASVIRPLEAEAGDFVDCESGDCPNRAKELETKYRPILRATLDQGTTPDHTMDPNPNPNTPQNGTPYPPLPGSAPVR